MNLYRGFKSIPEIGAIKKVRKDRKPRDLDINTHNKVDEYFYEKFGIKFRSQSLFCTGSINNAKKYGDVAVIQPLGNYVVCWSSKCDDLIEILYSPLSINAFLDENMYEIGNLENALLSGNEIMLFCDEYEVIAHV